ncbi:NLR family CARD domain-containing protein 4 [Holothuria leucospilota]|uniref:NLR family CARD domain-containing protein 4 n=1 Tax=Holothuria leucospilota TaxID=206669 RepID=A0A9Q1CRZ9_HOLLE|nr:NLR family CARD domain-containing protein 4 [Holothuria leucospilota]
MTMRTSSGLGVLVLLIATFYCSGVHTKGTCESPQFLELYKRGIINCMFHEEFFSVLWYNTLEYLEYDPILDYQNTIKTGVGYESGEFDVYPNGSLIINRVSPQHDFFTVAYLHTRNGVPKFIHIQIVGVDIPDVGFPVINLCGNSSRYCYIQLDSPSVKCSVSKTRSEVMVSLCARTINGDKNISSEISITTDGGRGYTSSVISTDVFHYSPLLVLLACKAYSPPGILKNNESMILVQNGDIGSGRDKLIVRHFQRNKMLKLECAEKDIGFVVWKKMTTSSTAKSEVLLSSLFIGETVTEIVAEDVSADDQGSLVITEIQVKHEGRYECIYGNGLSDGAILYDVNIIVPAYPVIEGCNQQQYCVLNAEYEGNVTCKVTGIRPQVQLRWKTLSNGDIPLIVFKKQQLLVTENGDTFDVVLVSEYRITDKSHDKVTVQCDVVATQEQLLGLTVKMDLLLEKVNESPTSPISKSFQWIVPVIVAVCLVLVLGMIIEKICRRNNSTKQVRNVGEMIPMFEESHPTDTVYLVEMKQKFLKQVRERYKDLYDAVQPIPYIKDRLYCVDRVFVEGGIEYLDSRTGDAKGHWTSLASYQNVFDNSHVKSPRRILEGEPGYGKSTVTLQFAYDWCNFIPTSPLRDVEILVLLRLRQLGGVESIYRAIKQFILPRDSPLSEIDIEHILQDSGSVVVILDGFDEYPDQDSTSSDVISIIARQMFQDFEVVLTTRSSVLPKKYPPLTKRLRLTGFDEKARRYYIRKAVVGDNDDSVRKIEGYLEENPILSNLCQVPLLFVIFAHMTNESEKFRKLNSVTSFFRHMISCFHSHMRNKMNDENVCEYETFENSHRALDKLAFEAFSGQSQKLFWDKDEMCQLVGEDFYYQYKRIGILVEEEEFDVTEHVQYKTEVKFYHKLFCEWYAAHYLADLIKQNPNLNLNECLQHLDPFDVQYLYRFVCGLNSLSSEKIIAYLTNIEGGDKFAILCILEKTGEIDNIMETIRQLCFEGLVISGHDSLLLQRSSMQLLEIATRNDIPIEYVQLHNCFQLVDLSTAAIRTTSGLTLSSKIPVKQLWITLYNRGMTEDEYVTVVDYSSMCTSLHYLGLAGSPPPNSFEVGPALSSLSSRNVTVKYLGVYTWSSKCILNFSTGRWEREHDGLECTEEDFARMKEEWDRVKDDTDEAHKRDVQNERNRLRKEAEQKLSQNN